MGNNTSRRSQSQKFKNIPSISAGSFSTMPVQHRGRRRRSKSIVGRAAQNAVLRSKEKTWIVPLILLTLLVGWYFVNPNGYIKYGIFLSYPIPGTNPAQYGKGRLDIAFCLFYALFFTFCREFIMQEIIARIGRHFNIRAPAKLRRFEEQAYTCLYFTVMGSWGLYVMKQTPMWFFNTDAFWEEYPHFYHVGSFKAFYLIEAAYWIQQALVLILQLEKPRKDFKELVVHHIITLLLIGLSYYFHFTWIGLAVFITMDTSDIWLALSKCLNYVNTVIVYPIFVIFVFVWIYMRHYLNFKIMWAVWGTMRTINSFDLDWAAEQYKCWISRDVTLILLTALQLVNIYWLILILRIGYRAFTTNDTHDERSEDEDEEVSDEKSSAKKND
ncbi:sphingosine N-acyltransferase Lac1 [Schizosaccharomyces pombe]|uniref:Sphingosine N-acyltransferase lac1 n=1 Tax=Schizosaccharomyces pombe (strain 972 / ATCC 24843) TaxID=284812 RepID=LAC1_SCHPO|nr:sphingosine N-acyltransferase Lac1 [Schizosaccharomyces pombe]O59735.2 RecName: Full=Sphingosine N-acyltransferase lac1; AltName: Full=Meiotically up-regulated gene 83 protein [Schizosaccharomyces pombe 972h-]CAA19018.2 sphingosine N-acyltransferase Lac1 [Schizosaccharomyces pombe]|eukprot:NP_596102.1 sphingosine N-acyltransferase Lac1 [Schizosaccharomyces pombe]